MILKFRFKDDFWERSALAGSNYFIKNPTTGSYQNFGIGELKNYKIDQSAIVSEKMLTEQLRRKNVEILEEYDSEQGELLIEGDSETSST